MTTKTNDQDGQRAVLEAVSHELALHDADNAEPTLDDLRWERELDKRMLARIAERSRTLTPTNVSIENAPPIRGWIAALGRDALLEQIGAQMQARPTEIQVAARDLTGLTDHDLRQLLDLLAPRDGAE